MLNLSLGKAGQMYCFFVIVRIAICEVSHGGQQVQGGSF